MAPPLFPAWAAPFSRPFGATPPPAPQAPFTPALNFWQSVRHPFAGDFPGAGLARETAGELGQLGSDIGAAWGVVGGAEDPVTLPLPPPPKPSAGKVDPKTHPVPATVAGGTDVLQKSGPVDAPTMGSPFTGAHLPVPPADPEKAPGMVSVTLPDGRTFDYAKGEHIPLAEQGHFGGMTVPDDIATAAGVVHTGRSHQIGGTGHPGGFVTGVTDESELSDLQHAADMTRARAGVKEAFPEIAAKARAEEGVRVAQAEANKAVERDKLNERIQSEHASERMNAEYEQQRAQAERTVQAAEARAKTTGREEDIKRAAELRDAFELQASQAERNLDRRLAIKGVHSGYDRHQ